MDEFEATFTPAYNRRQWYGVLASPLLLAMFVYAIFTVDDPDPIIYAGGVLFMLGVLALPFLIVRRIRFGERMIVERYLVPPRVLEYSEIVDVGMTSIRTSHGCNISLQGVENVSELKQMLATALAHAGEEIEGELARKEKRSLKITVIAALVSAPFSILLSFMAPSWLRFAGELSFVAVHLTIFLLTFALFQLLMPRPDRSSRHSGGSA